jgi:hypothetical protein
VAAFADWLYKAMATWYGAAIIGGLLILAFERWDRRREPSDADVRRAADLYRQHYGDEAFRVIGDHMLAARFAPDGRHSRFLQRVSTRLLLEAPSFDAKGLLSPKTED